VRLIHKRGELAAVVGHTRASLLPHVERRPEANERRRRVLAKCLYALAIAAGRRPGVYRELEAEAFACGSQPGLRRRRAGGRVFGVPL
jgi:hypothetical protein